MAACNARGCGPDTPPGLVRTLEDVPTAAPGQLRCQPLGPRRLTLSWQPPPVPQRNGNLRGYKVKTEATQERHGQWSGQGGLAPLEGLEGLEGLPESIRRGRGNRRSGRFIAFEFSGPIS